MWKNKFIFPRLGLRGGARGGRVWYIQSRACGGGAVCCGCGLWAFVRAIMAWRHEDDYEYVSCPSEELLLSCGEVGTLGRDDRPVLHGLLADDGWSRKSCESAFWILFKGNFPVRADQKYKRLKDESNWYWMMFLYLVHVRPYDNPPCWTK